MRTLLAASSGGHLAELFHLRNRLPFDPGQVTWFTSDTPQSRSLLAGEEVVLANHAPPRDWLAAASNARLAAAMCRHFRFDAAVSTGASVAVSALPVARRHGARCYYLESAARVAGPSLSGRILAATPGIATSSQSRRWSSDTWPFAGSVFDNFEPGPRRSAATLERVVVTLGSQEGYPFDRLLAALSSAVPSTTRTLWQTGATDGASHGIDGVALVPALELQHAMAHADLVVAHAGVGSALSALVAGAHPLLVPRLSSFGEHVDDHQVQIAEELHELGLATTCSPDEIDTDLLERISTHTTSVRPDPPALRLDP